jgi:hypothetical protein
MLVYAAVFPLQGSLAAFQDVPDRTLTAGPTRICTSLALRDCTATKGPPAQLTVGDKIARF